MSPSARDQAKTSENGPKWFLIPKNLGFDTKSKPVAYPGAELLLHEEVYPLLSEGDHVVDTHVNVVVHAKRGLNIELDFKV